MIEGLDQRFTDSIIAEGCATPRLFLERTLARLPPTLGGVYFAAMIARDETPVCCDKQSPEGTQSVALVCCFAYARNTRRVKLSRCSPADSTRARSLNGSRSALCRSRRDVASRLPLLPLSPLPTRRALRPPITLRRSNPSFKVRLPALDH